MSESQATNDPLVNLYRTYIREPDSRTNAYGYWLLVAGFALGVLGILTYLLSPSAKLIGSATRTWTFVLVELALPMTLLGIVFMLPVKRSGQKLAGAGFVISLLAIVFFITVYPQDWLTGPAGATGEVIALYSVGVGLIAIVAALVPFATGEQSYLAPQPQSGSEDVDGSSSDEESPVILGQLQSGGRFAVYRDGSSWDWWLLHEQAVAGSGRSFDSRTSSVDDVETVKALIDQSGVLEFKHAAFRLFQPTQGTWSWNLLDDQGRRLAEAAELHDSREDAEGAVGLLADEGEEAPLLTIDGAAFDIGEEAGMWHWRLINDAREPLALGPDRFETRDAAEAAVEEVRSGLSDAQTIDLDRYAVELRDDDGAWDWRLLAESGTPIATSASTFGSRTAAESGAEDVLDNLENLSFVRAGEPRFDVLASDGGWHWRFSTAAGDIVARSDGTAAGRADAEAAASAMPGIVSGAEVFTVERGSFEVYPTDADGWAWRLTDHDREELAVSSGSFEDEAATEEAIGSLKELVQQAELIEFDGAAFQLYEADETEWRWRLIDADGNELADSGEDYFSRDEAASTIPTLKEYAPEAELIEIDTAAFELFRNEDHDWNWRLVDETGDVTAEGREPRPSKRSARAALDHFISHATESEIFRMAAGAFHLYLTGDEAWSWRVIQPDGSTVAVATEDYGTRDGAEAAVEAFADAATDASTTVVDGYLVEVNESGGQWRWRLVDQDRTPIASGETTYDDRESVVDELTRLSAEREDIVVFDIDRAAIVLRPTDAGWEWTMIDAEWTTLATGSSAHETSSAAREAIAAAKRHVADADLIEYDSAAFQLEETAEGWRWTLLGEDERVVAKGVDLSETSNEAESALETVRGTVGDASVIEIDSAAFEINRLDDGWRWQLVDQTGEILARSLDAYPARQDARDALRLVQTHGPEAPTTVTE